jgi:hypothetical protein
MSNNGNGKFGWLNNLICDVWRYSLNSHYFAPVAFLNSGMQMPLFAAANQQQV